MFLKKKVFSKDGYSTYMNEVLMFGYINKFQFQNKYYRKKQLLNSFAINMFLKINVIAFNKR